ncbi:RNA polymerase sigma factor [Tessaracoccus antarcticus]|uniref:RNA polymerase sigma factor n=1 Tax=Tessaracoccus antarcticus TaxID=2479848 RepID=A0A3M0GHX8_9ACTN|nr:RNA polymerase sigma factor [Tessaracoccus antarcticus]RMB62262.1 RNA polymerase sigma factor [Tessaracoccus antarcticus]
MEHQRRARFVALYEDHVDAVMLHCLRHLAPAVAEDAVSDTFMTAWRKLDDVPPEPRGWLIVTARNTIRNRYRTQARAVALETRLQQITQLAADPADVTAERRADLLTALGALTEDEREAILLVSWDGLTGAEAASALKCSHGALRVRVHRARTKMAAALGDAAPTSVHLGSSHV